MLLSHGQCNQIRSKQLSHLELLDLLSYLPLLLALYSHCPEHPVQRSVQGILAWTHLHHRLMHLVRQPHFKSSLQASEASGNVVQLGVREHRGSLIHPHCSGDGATW